jgi:hypothetical protein
MTTQFVLSANAQARMYMSPAIHCSFSHQELTKKNESIQQIESRSRIEIDTLTAQIQSLQQTISQLMFEQQSRDSTRTDTIVKLNGQVCYCRGFPQPHSIHSVQALSGFHALCIAERYVARVLRARQSDCGYHYE